GSGTGGSGTGGSGTGGSGTGGSGTGGSGTGGSGTGGSGTGGSGTGGSGTGGSGTGGSGTGGSGTGGSGVDGGTDAPAESANDAPVSGVGGAGGAGGLGGAADAGGDAGCGAGCPSSVRLAALAIWLAADTGVECDQTTMRVTSWINNGSRRGALTPLAGKMGPRCAGATTLSGRNVISFDAPTTDEANGVLRVQLGPLLSMDGYTVFVVERRQSSDEGYFLGTSLNPLVPAIDCPQHANHAYRFGYGSVNSVAPDPKYLFYGGYVVDPNTDDCFVPQMAPPVFSSSNPQAALDVEVFDPTMGHKVFGNGTMLASDLSTGPIEDLVDGWVGRAYQQVDSPPRHSRFHGDIAEIVIYEAALIPTEVQDVSNYLAARWGITLNH
ncbi:MAG TPA: hypothetical protein VFH68_04280, partial [Polyangia bacterium]|nr:hypothetical protein [Polyangia bacterium]